MLWVRISIRCYVYSIMLCLSVTCDMSVISPGPPVSSTNKTDHHDISDILLKVTLNTIKPTNQIGQKLSKLFISHAVCFSWLCVCHRSLLNAAFFCSWLLWNSCQKHFWVIINSNKPNYVVGGSPVYQEKITDLLQVTDMQNKIV